MEIWEKAEPKVIINFYNPCLRLELQNLLDIQGQDRRKVIWCGDFNAHNIVWGGRHTDVNGRVIEELMDERELVCLNDGTGTRFNSVTGTDSVLDLTLVSSVMAGVSQWTVRTETTLGSDHYPVLCSIGGKVPVMPREGSQKWALHRADWEKFQDLCEEAVLSDVNLDSLESMNNQLTQTIMEAAQESIPKSKGRNCRPLVPWWTNECQQAVKGRNKALRLFKRTLSTQHLIQYKEAQAVVRRTVRQAKRASWRTFCSKIGRTTPVGEVWGMVKRMGGARREWDYPVLISESGTAISDIEKEAMAQSFALVHSSENLSAAAKRRKVQTSAQNPEALAEKVATDHHLDDLFTMGEMDRAIRKAKPTAPGKDQICYAMLKNLGSEARKKLLCLYNRVWIEGKLPSSWKEAVIVPIKKPGKDSSKPSSYRPIALTSNICKVMERMIVERLSFELEKRGVLASYQSGFRRARNTMDSVIRLENEVRKAQANKESVIAVFLI